MEKEEKLPVWHQTIDFDVLMREARKHITALSGKLWTDHNSSDPGITQLEVLAFCIADLSYRTSFGVDDILAGYKGEKALEIDLPLAHSALPNKPVTIKDLRKVLLDMPYPNRAFDSKKLLIRNAFPVIAEGTEIPFFAVSHKNKETNLTYNNSYLPEGIFSDQATEDDWATFENNAEIVLNGLYGIQLEFEKEESENPDDPLPVFLEDLNQNYFEQEVNTANNSYTISVLLPYWDDINWSLRNATLNQGTLKYRQRDADNPEDYFFAVDKLSYDDYFYDYYAELDLEGHLITAYIKLKPDTPIESSILIGGQTYAFQVNFLDWNELSNGVRPDYNSVLDGPNIVGVSNVSIDGVDQLFDIKSTIEITKNGAPKVITLLTRITFDTDEILPNESDVISALIAKFPIIYAEKIELETAVHVVMKNVSASMYTNYIAKLNKVFSHLYDLGGVWSYIGKFRNLCEDYSKFTASRIQEIALFGKLIVAPNFNINELLAEVYFRIDQFLHPLVKFNTLDEITEKGHTFENIFNGPLLRHGFIEDSDLDNLKRRSVVYTSDLVRILMDVPGVEAVEDFNISSYIDNRLMGRNVINCLSLTNPEVYKPRLSLEKSGLQVCVDDQKEAVDDLVIEEWYLHKLAEIKKEQTVLGAALDLSLPLGDDMEIEEYVSVQNDYPEIYGIGEFGLPADATVEREAQAKQLKGYLLMFEQLMANYLKQVAHLPELFSFNRTIDTTYATQSLYEVPNVRPLLHNNETFLQKDSNWEAFKQDLDNSYETAIRQGESKEEWRSRRNRFLSQLIGRFGESFEAYSVQMFNKHKDILNDPFMIGAYQEKRAEVLDELIDTKISFAEDLESITGGRYQSFDTTWLPTMSPFPGTWNSPNIGTYKLRLCRLLGIKAVSNQFVFGTGDNGDDIEGMHILEHILLRPRTSSSQFMEIQNRVDEEGSFVYDSDKDPYSFKVTIVLPVNAGRFKDKSFRNFTERLIQLETPAHIVVDFRWMNASCGKKFEKIYSQWKDRMFEMKPYLFQNNTDKIEKPFTQEPSKAIKAIKPLAQEQEEQKDKLGVQKMSVQATAEIETMKGISPQRKDVFEAAIKEDTILVLQNALIQVLNTPCDLTMKLYDASGFVYNEINNKITFEDKSSDVFHIRVSELQGTLRVYKWEESKDKWVRKSVFTGIEESYINVTELLGEQIGLTRKFGGVGKYWLTYQVEDRIVEKFIDVTKEIIPVRIDISNGFEMLNFNTETDGTFAISSKILKGYYLQMAPNGNGAAMISSQNGLAPTPLVLNAEDSNVFFATIYELYGAGIYNITYELDGQSTFATIEIVLEVAISVWDVRQELFPNDLNTIVIPSGLRRIALRFDPTGGSLSVYDRDAVLFNDGPIELDGTPPGQILFVKKATSLTIDRDNDPIWQDGKTYDFIYKFEGKQATVSIHFEKGIVQVELPTVALLKNDEPQDFPTIILPADDIYSVLCKPIGGIRSFYKEEGSENRLLEEVEITSENSFEEINLEDVESVHGVGNYFVIYTNEGGEATVRFSLVKKMDPIFEDFSLNIFNTEIEAYLQPKGNIYDLVFNYLNKDQTLNFEFSRTPGELLFKDGEEEFLEEQIEATRSFTSDELPSNDYEALYTSDGEELKFVLNVINLDPTFAINAVEKLDEGVFSAKCVPFHFGARTYIWRINGKYVSRAKEPQLKLAFTNSDFLEIELKVFSGDYEESYTLKVYHDQMIGLMNAK
ncbi:MAG: hypothetical protein ACJASQ_000519 [Crocinitomicaceae bacterium]|jgi:hypothetical protein